ncbi:MAG: ATP-binding cassette domain-containing protein [Pseudomonadota bacterium]
MSLVYDLSGVAKQRGPIESGFRLKIDHLTIAYGSHTAIIGQSGSGKSTCLDLLALSLSPTKAERFWLSDHQHTHDIGVMWQSGSEAALASLRRQSIGYILQTGGLLPFLTVVQNIMVMAADHGPKTADHAAHLIDLLKIAHCKNKLPEALSIGERQRAAIARALVTQPAIVLADEPTASLDAGNAAQVIELFIEIAEQQNTAIILVTHDVSLAMQYGFDIVTCRPQHNPDGGALSIIDDRLDKLEETPAAAQANESSEVSIAGAQA